MKKLTKILAGTWMILSLFMAFPNVVSANGNLTIIVKNPNPYDNNQSSFSYQKKPGEMVDDVAVVKNLSDSPVKAHVYAVDATSNESGSFILKLENEKRAGIGLWTKLDAGNIVTIPPKQSVDFPFHIAVPQNIVPGQYFGGLVMEEVDDTPQIIQTAAASTNGQTICCTNIQVKTRIGLRIYLTIPGTVNDRMEWSGFKTVQKNKSVTFQFEIRNSGSVALEPVATVEVFDNMGNEVDRFEKSLGESLPNTYIAPSITWEHQPLFGSFKAVAKVDYKIKNSPSGESLHGSAAGSKSADFTVIPWNILLFFVLCGLAGVIVYWAYCYKQRQLRLNWESYTIKPGDNVMKISLAHNVEWEKLVRVNKIRPPYLVNEGEKIKVPKPHNPNQQSLFEKDKHKN